MIEVSPPPRLCLKISLRRFHRLLVPLLLSTSALLSGCQEQSPVTPQRVAAQLSAFETQ